MTRPNDAPDDERIERWLNERAVSAPRPDRDVVLRASLQQLPTTNQRRRWWSVRWFQSGNGAMRSAQGGTLHETGRTRTMFTATRITVIMAIAAFGATALLWAALPDGERPSVPGASMPDAATASTFTGSRLNDATERTAATRELVDGVTHSRGSIQNGITVESTDPRFSGVMDFTFHGDLYFGQGAGAFWGDQKITNEDGSWAGSIVGAGDPTGHWRASGHFVGAGAYEDLVAIVYFDSDLTHEGAIVPGDLPPRE